MPEALSSQNLIRRLKEQVVVLKRKEKLATQQLKKAFNQMKDLGKVKEKHLSRALQDFEKRLASKLAEMLEQKAKSLAKFGNGTRKKASASRKASKAKSRSKAKRH